MLWPATTGADKKRPAWQQDGPLYGELARLTDLVWTLTGQRLAISHIARASADQGVFSLGLDGVAFLDGDLKPLPAGSTTPAFAALLTNLLKETVASFGFLEIHDSGPDNSLRLISKDPIFAVEKMETQRESEEKTMAQIPVLKFKTPPGSAPAGHQLIDSPVAGSGSQRHNIAAVQAALRLIMRPVNNDPFWKIGIDGQWSDKLKQTIIDFQAASGLVDANGKAQSYVEPGKVAPNGPTEKHLIGRLPKGMQRIKAVKGTTELYLDARPSFLPPLVSNQTKAAFGELPSDFQAALEMISQALRDELGLMLQITIVKSTLQKPALVAFKPLVTAWVNGQMIPQPQAQIPANVKRIMEPLITGLPHFKFSNTNQLLNIQSERKLGVPEENNFSGNPQDPSELGYELYLVAVSLLHDESIPGHLFVGGIQPNGKQEAWGFYPFKGDNDLRNVKLKYMLEMLRVSDDLFGRVEDDKEMFLRALNNDNLTAYLKFDVGEASYREAITNMRNRRHHFDYGLFSNSCVDAAFEAFEAAQIELPLMRSGPMPIVGPMSLAAMLPDYYFYQVKSLESAGEYR